MEKANEYKNLGNEAFKNKEYEKSIEHFTQAIEINPNDHIYYSNRSGSYACLLQYEQALNDAVKCVQLSPSWGKGYVRKGLALFYLEKYDEAIETYKQGLQIDPANQQLNEGLERAKEEKEFMELAGNAKQNLPGGMGAGMDNNFIKGMFGKLQENPKTREYLKDKDFMAKLQMMSKNPQMFSVLSAQDPRIQEALQVMLGGMDLGGMGGKPPGGNQQEDSSMFEEIPIPEYKTKPQEQKKPEPTKPKQEPVDPAEAYKLEGNEYYKQKDFTKALECYDKAIEAKPEEILYYNNKAAVYIEMNDLSKALEVCNQALQVKEDNMIFDFLKLAKLYARLGSVHEKLGNIKEAIDWYGKSLLEDKQKPTMESLKRVEAIFKQNASLAYINPELGLEANTKANEFFKKGDFPEAKKYYDDAVKRDPKNPKYYCNRGIVFQKLMEFPSALRDFEQCIEFDSKYIKVSDLNNQKGLQQERRLPLYDEGLPQISERF